MAIINSVFNRESRTIPNLVHAKNVQHAEAARNSQSDTDTTTANASRRGRPTHREFGDVTVAQDHAHAADFLLCSFVTKIRSRTSTWVSSG